VTIQGRAKAKAPSLLVPWVTLWSAEVIPPERTWILPGLDHVSYRDQRHSDRHLGVIWHREQEAQRQGDPLWREVHSRRQRRAMLDPRCQVCGGRLFAPDLPWLFPRRLYENLQENELRTITPPTCEECWPLAEARCPHLRGEETVRLHVGYALPWGVMGDFFHPLKRAQRIYIPFTDNEMLRYTIAKQVVVQLDGVVEVT